LKTATTGAGAAAVYAKAHGTDLHIHDPSIIYDASTVSFYSYSVGPRMLIHQSPTLDGPWTELGSLLPADSIIPKGDRKAPWAPSTIQINGRFYCYYAVSNAGCRDSAVGVASSDSPGPGAWTDHGLLIQSGTGAGADQFPLNQSNTIDPSIFVDTDGSVYLTFGSFWTGIWEVKLGSDLISVAEDMDARHLAAEPVAIFPARKNANSICGDPTGGHPIEGSFLSYHGGWYYLWFSWGRCCEFKDERMRTNGKEYAVHPLTIILSTSANFCSTGIASRLADPQVPRGRSSISKARTLSTVVERQCTLRMATYLHQVARASCRTDSVISSTIITVSGLIFSLSCV
jgi:arabinan endo-1,5-alpha-L-arabinosidase